MRTAQVSNSSSCPPPAWVEEQYARLQPSLIRYVARQLRGNPEMASDVVQEAFAKLCQQPWPDIESHSRAWLYRVCRNRAVDLLRAEGRMSQTIEPQAQVESLSDKQSSSPHEQLDQAEQLELVRTQIGKLSHNQQEVLRLRLQENLSYKEIAEVTGLSVSNVGFQLHEALCNLKNLCRAYEF
ncbi:MAG: sigma-70 family RNA polymerase sigma factor [Pirellulales bacterium]